MNCYRSVLLLSAASVGLAFPGWAAEPFALEEIIVTARGKASTISQTPGGVGVVDYASLYEEQDVSITNTLRQIPGVDKSSDSAWGSAVNIRGLGRNQVVFLIDGCRVNTASEINAQFGFIDANDVERIEVLKGPISSLYGSGSMGGVVNVITKKGSFTPETGSYSRIGVSAGSNPGGYNIFGSAWMNSPDFWLYASGGRRDYDSYENGDGNEISNSQFDDYNVNMKMGYKWNDSNITVGNIQYHKGEDIGIPGKGLVLPAPPKVTYPDTYRTLVSLNHRIIPAGSILSESDINLFYQKIDRNVSMQFPPKFPMVKSIHPSAQHTTYGVKWKNIIDLESHGIVAGVDVWSWDIESSRTKNLRNGRSGKDTPLADAREISAGIFIEDDISLSQDVVLNLGGRLDYIHTESDALYNWIVPPAPIMPIIEKRPAESQSDMAWDGHAGLTWNLSSSWSTTLIAAASYRAPDLMDRYKYLPFPGGETYGNPDLDPERSYFLEWGGHYSVDEFSFSTALYANFIDDMITEERVAPRRFEMENVEEAKILGAELSGQWQITPQFLLYGNLALTRGTNETTDSDLPFIPPVNGLAGISYHAGDTGLYGDLNLDWACKQDRVAPKEPETDGWATVNARIGYKTRIGTGMHDFVLGVDNLFDEQYSNHLSTSRGMELTEPGLNLYCAWKVEL